MKGLVRECIICRRTRWIRSGRQCATCRHRREATGGVFHDGPAKPVATAERIAELARRAELRLPLVPNRRERDPAATGRRTGTVHHAG